METPVSSQPVVGASTNPTTTNTLAEQCGVTVHLVSDAAWYSTPEGAAAVAKFRQEISTPPSSVVAPAAAASASTSGEVPLVVVAAVSPTSLPVMGLDTEWASDTTVAVLQISSCFTQCFVLQLAVAAGYDPTGIYIPGGASATADANSPTMSRNHSAEHANPAHRQHHHGGGVKRAKPSKVRAAQKMPNLDALHALVAPFKDLLADEGILKTGVNVKEDLKKLGDLDVVVRGPCDLSQLAVRTPEAATELTGVSLAAITKAYVGGFILNKDPKVVRSAWEARDLTQIQVDYAADDAVAGAFAFKDMWTRHGTAVLARAETAAASRVKRAEPHAITKMVEGSKLSTSGAPSRASSAHSHASHHNGIQKHNSHHHHHHHAHPHIHKHEHPVLTFATALSKQSVVKASFSNNNNKESISNKSKPSKLHKKLGGVSHDSATQHKESVREAIAAGKSVTEAFSAGLGSIADRGTKVFDIDGNFIFWCEAHKADWYVHKKGLATVRSSDPESGKYLEIQLNFVPQHKTKVCRNFLLNRCTFGDTCAYAHGAADLREVDPRAHAAAAVIAAKEAALKAVRDDPLGAVRVKCDVCSAIGGGNKMLPSVPGWVLRLMGPETAHAIAADVALCACSTCQSLVRAVGLVSTKTLYSNVLAEKDAAADALASPPSVADIAPLTSPTDGPSDGATADSASADAAAAQAASVVVAAIAALLTGVDANRREDDMTTSGVVGMNSGNFAADDAVDADDVSAEVGVGAAGGGGVNWAISPATIAVVRALDAADDVDVTAAAAATAAGAVTSSDGKVGGTLEAAASSEGQEASGDETHVTPASSSAALADTEYLKPIENVTFNGRGLRLFTYSNLVLAPDRCRKIPPARLHEVRRVIVMLWTDLVERGLVSDADRLAAVLPSAPPSSEPELKQADEHEGPQSDPAAPASPLKGHLVAAVERIAGVVTKYNMDDWVRTMQSRDAALYFLMQLVGGKSVIAAAAADSAPIPATVAAARAVARNLGSAPVAKLWGAAAARHFQDALEAELAPHYVPWCDPRVRSSPVAKDSLS